MDCGKVQRQLPHLISGHVAGKQAEILLEHIEHCARCAQEKAKTRELWDRLGYVVDVEVPGDLRERTLEGIYAAAEGERITANAKVSGRRIWGAVAMGTTWVLLYTLMLAGRMNLAQLPPGALVLSTVLWTGMLLMGLLGMLGRYTWKGVDLALVFLFGTGATVLSLIGAYLCPETTFFQMWENSAFATRIERAIGRSGGYILFGMLYALPPAMLASVALGGRLKGRRLLRNGLVMGGVFFLLWLPAAYVQCSSLVLALIGSWGVGALAGAVGGALSGLGVYVLKDRLSLA